MLKQPRIRDEKYRRYIAEQPCLICGGTDVQASHIRIGQEGGMGLKPGDDLVWPLCVAHHAEFDAGQREFIHKYADEIGLDIMRELKAILRTRYGAWKLRNR